MPRPTDVHTFNEAETRHFWHSITANVYILEMAQAGLIVAPPGADENAAKAYRVSWLCDEEKCGAEHRVIGTFGQAMEAIQVLTLMGSKSVCVEEATYAAHMDLAEAEHHVETHELDEAVVNHLDRIFNQGRKP